ncbi:hypothetical protein SAMN03159434_11754 [Enterobacter sp. NFR05]|nr:hypothetical protein SAMN03159434_11754 [Enterobacter sp. NFR05]
MYCFLNFCSI